MSKSNEELSLKKEVKLYGVTVRKMPNGAYFRALQTLKNLPKNFIEMLELDENSKLSDLLDTKNIGNIIVKLLMVLPGFTIDFLSELMDIDRNVLEEELNPTETIEIAKKFWEINRLNDFFEQLKPIIANLMKRTSTIGFNEQSQSVLKSE